MYGLSRLSKLYASARLLTGRWAAKVSRILAFLRRVRAYTATGISRLAAIIQFVRALILAVFLYPRVTPWYPLLAGTAVGAAAWSGHVWAIPLVFLLPVLLRLRLFASTQGTLTLLFGYFCGALWPMIPGASLFLANRNFLTESLLLWLFYALLQTVPYLLALWRPGGTAAGFALATLLTVASPIAILNPITAAGASFPGTGVFGLLLTVGLFTALPAIPRLALAAGASAALLTGMLYEPTPVPAGWAAVDTYYGGSSFTMPGKSEYLKAATLRDTMSAGSDTLRLYPEATLLHWNEATDRFFTPLARQLAAQKRTLILGASITHRGGVGYDNALIVFGADRGIYLQHLPMPYSMWNPYAPNSVPLRVLGPYTIRIHQLTAAPVICYEQLHPYPFLRASFDHPQITLAVANDYWAQHTYIRGVQHAALDSWSRLFNTPYLSATNQ